MTAAPTAPSPTGRPNANLGRAGRLLGLVRRLIDYGRELAVSLQQRGSDLAAITHPFGVTDIALILATIARGLFRANALEARLVQNAARLDARPKPRTSPAQRTPRVVLPAAQDPAPASLPTEEQIAAEVPRRPIGAVIADICRDLGILPSHPLWPEIRRAITAEGGNLGRLIHDSVDRVFQPMLQRSPAGAVPPLAAPTCTGPP